MTQWSSNTKWLISNVTNPNQIIALFVYNFTKRPNANNDMGQRC